MPTGRVHLQTLGCPKNEVDSDILQRHLRQAGCLIVDTPEAADVEIINTCGFIEPAKIESLDAIWKAVDRKAQTDGKGRKLIVTGCLAQRYAQQLANEIVGIDAIIAFDRPDLVLRAIDSSSAGAPACWVQKPGRVYRDDQIAVTWPEDLPTPLSAYVKIADGCDNACRFCAIPLIRGRMRSRPLNSIVSEIRTLVAGGTKEVILVAQDTTSWGVDLNNGHELAGLLRAINQIEGSFWVRLTYAHPAFLTQRHIAAFADCEKIVPYLDLPLQHASDRMLAIMNRHTTRAETQAKIERLRAARPDVALRTTFIIGHPGETPADFEELLEFAEANAFERLGVFPYFQEEDTPSAHMSETVPRALARERIGRLTEAYDRWSAHQSVDKVGRTLECLLERDDGKRWEGRTLYDAPEIDGRVVTTDAADRPGFYEVVITDAMGVDLIGRLTIPRVASALAVAPSRPPGIH